MKKIFLKSFTNIIRCNSTSTTNKEIIKLTKDQVKRYYTLFKISDGLITTPQDRKVKQAESEWRNKSVLQQKNIYKALETIIHDAFNNREISIRDDLTTSEKDGIKRYVLNQTTGVAVKCRGLRHNTLINFYVFKEIRDMEFHDDLDRWNTIRKVKLNWKHVGSEARDVLFKEYEDLICRGKEIVDFKEVKIIDHFDFTTRVGDLSTKSEGSSKNHYPVIEIKHNATAGVYAVSGLSLRDGFNYYAWREMQTGDARFRYRQDHLEYLRNCWKEMTTPEQLLYQDEYEEMLQSGKIIVFGEIQPITSAAIANMKNMNYTKVWGYIPGNQRRKVEMVQCAINQTAGNLIIASKINTSYAWNYYLGKRSQKGIDYLSVYDEWQSMSTTRKMNVVNEYKSVLESGRDMLDGKIVTIEEKYKQFNMEIPQILGQSILSKTNGGGRIPSSAPAPVIYDPNKNAGIIIGEIKPFHVYNYYLGIRLRKEPDVGKLEEEWIQMTDKEKDAVRQEYVKILEKGQDMLYGKLVPLRKKQAAYRKVSKKSILGLRTAMTKNVEPIENELPDEDEAKEYYIYSRLQDNVAFADIQKEWRNMNPEEKEDIIQSYQLLVATGQKLENGNLIKS
ncbi:hypothetical protein G210_4836 [Candida maltosa Xu316]|uniref:Uncharacterized protein n=1 Tax=Candida maltosa (strain Xu316) TaxID=1245528 RepID=M3HRJ9_CANMX|nr:hypothetical protein G210_4836 [Candida maltosa Xu316]